MLPKILGICKNYFYSILANDFLSSEKVYYVANPLREGRGFDPSPVLHIFSYIFDDQNSDQVSIMLTFSQGRISAVMERRDSSSPGRYRHENFWNRMEPSTGHPRGGPWPTGLCQAA